MNELQDWTPATRPDSESLKSGLRSLPTVRARGFEQIIRRELPHAILDHTFPYLLHHQAHVGKEHREVDLGVAQCYVWKFRRPFKINSRKVVGVLMACYQQAARWADYAFVHALDPAGLEDAAYYATLYEGYCADCRLFGVAKDTGARNHKNGLVMTHRRCNYCGAVDEHLVDPRKPQTRRFDAQKSYSRERSKNGRGQRSTGRRS